MRTFRITLFIADLPMLLRGLSYPDMKFLKSNYRDYLQPTQRIHASIAPMIIDIQHTDNSNTPSHAIVKTHYTISITSLQKQFLYFNQSLRILFTHYVLRHGGILFHGSTIIHKGQGHIFLGQEGAGKSTIQKLLSPYISLGDDTAIVRVISNTFYLFGSPFYQKTNMAYPNRRVPILRCYLLHQSEGCMIYRLSPANAAPAFIANAFLVKNTGVERRLLFETIAQVGLNVPVYNLWFENNAQVKNFIFQQINKLKAARRGSMVQINSAIEYPLTTQWQEALCTIQFLGNCRVIREASWLFEFNSCRRIEDIASQITRSTGTARHGDLVKKICRGSSILRHSFVGIISKTTITLIDGNHHAIAAYLTLPKHSTISCTLGILPKEFRSSYV